MLVTVPCTGGGHFCPLAAQRPAYGSRPRWGESTSHRPWIFGERAARGNIYERDDIYDDGDLLSCDRLVDFMFKAIIIIAAACVLVYLLRRNFRRAWYVLRTGDENPDWEKLGGEYFVASWERRGLKNSAVKKEEAKAPK